MKNKLLLKILPVIVLLIFPSIMSASSVSAFDSLPRADEENYQITDISQAHDNYLSDFLPIMDVTYSDLYIYPLQVTAGYEVTISTVVTNNGSSEENHNANLIINDKVVSTQTICLQPAESSTITFTTTQNITGDYSVSIGTVSGSFTVVEPIATQRVTVYWEILIVLILSCVIIIWIIAKVLSKKNKESHPLN